MWGKLFVVNERSFIAIEIEHTYGVGRMLYQAMPLAYRTGLRTDLALPVAPDHIEAFANVGMHTRIDSFANNQADDK